MNETKKIDNVSKEKNDLKEKLVAINRIKVVKGEEDLDLHGCCR